jgi:hypothetical protein
MNELYTHIQYVFFSCVLILKVVIYCKPSLVIILKESKYICMSYIIINPWPSCIEIFEYFDEFTNLCTSIDAWCIFVSINLIYETFEGYDHGWCFHNVGVKKLYSKYI